MLNPSKSALVSPVWAEARADFFGDILLFAFICWQGYRPRMIEEKEPPCKPSQTCRVVVNITL